MADDPLRLAREREAAGDLDAALAAYAAVPPASPHHATARIRLVGLRLLRGEHAEAERTARDFAAANPDSPDALATLGQTLKLCGRPEESFDPLARAAALAPGRGYDDLLHDARRALHWRPDPDLHQALSEHAPLPDSSPESRYRWSHCLVAGLLNPEVLRWIPAAAPRELEARLPDSIRESLDARFAGRYTESLREAADASLRARLPGAPYGPAEARVTLTDGSAHEGKIEDGDSTIGGAFETATPERYEIVPFGSVASIEFGRGGAWIPATLTPATGAPRELRVSALYLFTEGSRRPELRDGRATAWRELWRGLRFGLGGRTFIVSKRPIHVGLVRRIDFRR